MRHRRRSSVVRAPEINWHDMAKIQKPPKSAKPGDWTCTSCHFLNYASRTKCKECATCRPQVCAVCCAPEDDDLVEKVRVGDWRCRRCHTIVYAWRDCCVSCHEHRGDTPPIKNGLADVPMLPRDWICRQCQVVNFASRKACFACRRKRAVVCAWGVM